MFASEDSSGKGVLIWINLKEPEITFAVPQEYCICWIAVDISGI